MAKNWTIKELAVAINENDFTGIQDVGRRFPIALAVMVKAASGDKEAFNTLMGAIPEHITVRKINSALADGVEESDEDGEETEVNAEVEEKPVKKGPAKKKEAEPKLEKKAKKVKPAKPAKEEAEEEEESDDEDGNADYGSMTARELFELCNSRGLKAEPKKPASHYIAILEAADNGGNSGDEDDDWDI